MKHNVIIEPLSANRAWLGRKWKTQAYQDFEKKMMVMLPRMQIGKPPYHVHFTFGFSNKMSDLDNACKQSLDCLCKRYLFNDRDVYKLTLEKVITKKQQEFIEFSIESI